MTCKLQAKLNLDIAKSQCYYPVNSVILLLVAAIHAANKNYV